MFEHDTLSRPASLARSLSLVGLTLAVATAAQGGEAGAQRGDERPGVASTVGAGASLWTLVGEAGLDAGRPELAGPELAGAKRAGLIEGLRPEHAAMARVDARALRAALAAAPLERVGVRMSEYASTIELPTPSGRLERFLVAESPIMAPELAARFPDIRTYVVRGLDDTSASGRLDMTPSGLRGMLRTGGGAVLLDPAWLNDPAWSEAGDNAPTLLSYFLHDLPGSPEWACGVKEGLGEGEHGLSTPPELAGGDVSPAGPPPAEPVTLRTYRIAVACTGEFGVFHSNLQGRAPNVADPLAAIVTMINRSNAVYQIDLGVRFELVANNDQLMFLDPDADPYPSTCGGGGGTDCSGQLLSPNISTLNARIGAANYDVGHLVTRVVGGVAFLSSVCTSNKAGGISGTPRGGNEDAFSALVVIHELGHQFGAGHTFNGALGRCANNASGQTAWEPGSGSTPMAYAGACPVGDVQPSDNIVRFADPWFHHGSLLQMQAFVVSGAGNRCDVTSSPGHTNPVIVSQPPSTVFVPPLTPFRLEAAAQDDGGSESLTYSWEQFDRGPQLALAAPDNGLSPLFRVFPPVAVGYRDFPRLADTLSGIPTPGERLPSVVPSTRTFRAVVRDNRPDAGGTTMTGLISVQIPEGSSPFSIVAPVPAQDVPEGPLNIVWNAGNTAGAPFNIASVSISLSTDNGQSFSVTLTESTTNDGVASVNIPPGLRGTGRIRIDPNGGVFYAISGPLRLLPGCASADINSDGQSDFFDYLDFASDFQAGSGAADFDGSGQVDFFDYLEFVTAYGQC
ncbi:MAG: M12 family metallo-peptidase [Planctomycetota bacterium]|nr:M12 family metallo-peptidase [Planctomycetota bacterium]